MSNQTRENKQYQNEKIKLSLGGTALDLVLNLVLAFSGASIAIAAWSGSFSPNHWVQLAIFAAVYGLIVEAVELPLSFYRSYLHEHKWKLSTQTLGNWVLKRLKMYAIGLPFAALLIGGLYAIIWWTPQYWWLVAAGALLFVSIGLQRIVPVLIIPFMYKVEPITEGELYDRLHARARQLGFQIKQLSRIVMSEETKKSNAFIMGIGKSKRVMLFDTLIRDFTVDEVEVVFAHELGHSAHNHIWKGMFGSIVFTGISFWLCNLVFNQLAHMGGHGDIGSISALPLLVACLSVLGFILNPIQLAVSRHYERQADWYALNNTGNMKAFKSGFERLATLNKSDLDPAPLTVLMFYSHPPVLQRIAMADAWQELNRGAS